MAINAQSDVDAAAVARAGAEGLGQSGFPLSASTPCGPALAAILSEYRTLMCANEVALTRGEGGACLHDFRVAMRRARSLFKAFKRLLPKPIYRRLRAELAWLSARTGELRDLEVMLHALALPTALYAVLNPEQTQRLQAFVAQQHREAHARLKRALRSRHYPQLHSAWSAALASLAPATTAAGALTLTQEADDTLANSLRRLRTRLARTVAEPDMTALHGLRKECKRLRYVATALSSLYPRKHVAPVLADLKRLQSMLGELCDQHVQQSLVATWLQDAHADTEVLGVLDILRAHWAAIDTAAARAAAMASLRRFACSKPMLTLAERVNARATCG